MRIDVQAGSAGAATGTDDFKAFFRQLASGVCVVMFRAGGGLHGFTATSVTSVSLDPPQALFCASKRNDSHQFLQIGISIGVSILCEDHRHLSDRFAGKAGADGYDDVETIAVAEGMPGLTGALGHLQGRVTDIIAAGDHSIVVFAVEGAQAWPGDPPLVYFNQGYRLLAPIETAT
jgi:flavin reductase (DIM6/NTAB) family NADH-FMN oxidoreductase RutF